MFYDLQNPRDFVVREWVEWDTWTDLLKPIKMGKCPKTRTNGIPRWAGSVWYTDSLAWTNFTLNRRPSTSFRRRHLSLALTTHSTKNQKIYSYCRVFTVLCFLTFHGPHNLPPHLLFTCVLSTQAPCPLLSTALHFKLLTPVTDDRFNCRAKSWTAKTLRYQPLAGRMFRNK